MTGIKIDGTQNKVVLDDDADTYFEAATDDTIKVYVAGAQDFTITANTLTAESGSTIAAQALTATTIGATGVVTANAGVVVDNITIDGTEIDLSSGDLTLDAAGRIDLSADDNGEVRLFDGSSNYGQFKDDDDRFKIQGLIADKDMLFVVNNGGSEATSIVIDSTGAVTKPLQSCFHAELGSTTQSNFSTGSTTLEYKIERFDQNADFNTSNYTFTAPVTGKYLICANVELSNIDNANDYMRMRMNTSNLDYYQGIMAPDKVFSSDGGYFSMSMAQIVDMDASDTCLIQIQINSGAAQTDIVGTTANVFSGCLLA